MATEKVTYVVKRIVEDSDGRKVGLMPKSLNDDTRYWGQGMDLKVPDEQPVMMDDEVIIEVTWPDYPEVV